MGKPSHRQSRRRRERTPDNFWPQDAQAPVALARLELNGPRHKNPPESPYRPGEWIGETHLHLYREGFEDRIAYKLEDAPGRTDPELPEGIPALERFMWYCGIAQWPPIQTAL